MSDLDFELKILDKRTAREWGAWATRWLQMRDMSDSMQDAKAIGHRFVIQFDDLSRQDDYGNWTGPTNEHIREIIEFATTIKTGDRVLVNCTAGISRSPAAAIILLLARDMDPKDVISFVHKARETMWPNGLMIKLAEESLGITEERKVSPVLSAWKAERRGKFSTIF
jgi:predicted protein tyrosine phosphatase